MENLEEQINLYGEEDINKNDFNELNMQTISLGTTDTDQMIRISNDINSDSKDQDEEKLFNTINEPIIVTLVNYLLTIEKRCIEHIFKSQVCFKPFY
jgi:hypothetical protein